MLRFWYTDSNCKDSYLIYLFYFLSNIVSFLRVVIIWGSRKWWVFCVCSEYHSFMCHYIPIMSVLFSIKKTQTPWENFLTLSLQHGTLLYKEVTDKYQEWMGITGYPPLQVHTFFKHYLWNCFVVQSLSHVRSATWWTAACQASLSFTVSQSLLKLVSIEFKMIAIQPSHTLLPTSPPALNLSQPQDIYQWVSSSQYLGLISFRIDWFDLLAVQGTLKSLIQHHSLKHEFFSTQPSLWSSSHIHKWLLEKP